MELHSHVMSTLKAHAASDIDDIINLVLVDCLALPRAEQEHALRPAISMFVRTVASTGATRAANSTPCYDDEPAKGVRSGRHVKSWRKDILNNWWSTLVNTKEPRFNKTYGELTAADFRVMAAERRQRADGLCREAERCEATADALDRENVKTLSDLGGSRYEALGIGTSARSLALVA